MTLSAYITSNLKTPFEWGRHDCVLFASAWAKSVIGIDYLEGVPHWSDAKSGMRIIKKMGGLKKIVDDRLVRINPNFANDGDIALCDDRLCIFSGAHIVGPGENGLIFTDRLKALCAWSY